MRIIGQDRKIDVPYDNTSLRIRSNALAPCIELPYRIEVTNDFSHGEWDRVIGFYNTLDDAKAVLWKIAESYKENKPYFEMPQPDEELVYPYREEK